MIKRPAAQQSNLRLGIGVATYKRPVILCRTLHQLIVNTDMESDIVIADDGSEDDTQAVVSSFSDTMTAYLSGPNRGVAWNKNRLLLFLHAVRKCDVIVILEDDSFPIRPGWESNWIDASKRWGHANLAGDWFASPAPTGSGTPADPIRSPVVSGQCSVFSRDALTYVGFMDSRFGHDGGEHAEHSYRMARAGYGGYVEGKGLSERAFYHLIKSEIFVSAEESYFNDPQTIARSIRKFTELKNGPVFRAPWSDDEEREQMRREIAQARVFRGAV